MANLLPDHERILLGPGPSLTAPRVMRAMAAPTISHLEGGLEARWTRHERNHLALDDALAARGLSLLPPRGERLWTLNAIRVPEGIDEAAVRKHLLDEFNIGIGAGLGPLAGKIWRVGLMGASSAPRLIALLLGALDSALAAQRDRAHV